MVDEVGASLFTSHVNKRLFERVLFFQMKVTCQTVRQLSVIIRYLPINEKSQDDNELRTSGV